MGELEHQALSIVIAGHAGCLGSYRAGARARLFRAAEIVEESEAQVAIVHGRCGDLKPIGPLRHAMTERIRRFVPDLTPMPDTRPSPTPLCILTIYHITQLHNKWLSADLTRAAVRAAKRRRNRR